MIRKTIFLLLIATLFNIDISGQGIEGAILDSNGDPVPYASIFIKELSRGTTCNTMGLFSLPLPQGEYNIFFRSLGYTEVQKKIVINETFENLEITLPPQTYMIPEVRVSATGEDPAYWIMRKTIGLANYHLNEVLNYDAEIYIKGTAIFNNLPRAIAKRIEVNDVKVKEDEVYMLESLNEVKFTAPDQYDMNVIASQNTIPGYSESVNPMDYVNASLYEPQIETFLSPLARNAFYHYSFSFESSFIEGAYIIDKIKVTPKRKSQQLCEGYLYIVEDLWCLYSSDIAINTIAGTLYLQQLYANIIMDAWLPVNHKLRIAVEIVGIDANVTYVSSLEYKNVVLNPNLPKTYFTATSSKPEETEDDKPVSKEQEKIDALLEKDELTNREVLKLSKLMEKESGKGREEELKEPLNISGTTFSVAEDAVKNDSLYWNKVRPVPLTPEESLTLKQRDSIISISKPVSGSDSVKVKGRRKKTLTNIATGTSKTFSKGKGRFTYGGLLDIERLNFNTVDGLSYGQEFRFQYKIDSLHTFRTSLIGGYAFSRKAPLLVFKSDFLYAPMRRGLLGLTLDYRSSDFNATSGMGKFANLEYSLVFRKNYMKLYEKINASLYNNIDLVNGLALETKVDIGRQKSLANTTDYSFFYRNKRDYTPNLPDTAMQADDPYLIDRNRLAFDIKLKYTPRNYYVLRSGRKHMRGSDWPSFILNYQQSIPVDNQVWSNYSFVSGTVLYDSDIGLLSNLKGRFSGGYFINNSAMHFSDFNHFKSFPLLYDLIGLTNAYTLLDYYTSSSNDYWVEGHLTLTTAYLLIKYLPWFSERLWNESLSLSYLKTPSINHYTQLGYSLNEVFFLMDLGVYVAFEELKYSGVGFKLNFRF